ncbi:MAG: cysteine desulfurase [Clostridia bacterium]|nr:cysteine desulfurase [Clostridia bacterium]
MIYFDNAATTKPSANALSKAAVYLTEQYFNPSAMYREGFELHKKLKETREKLLSFVADPSLFELIFTSCGTESDNTAIFSSARRGNAVTTQGEHAAVQNSFSELKMRGIETRFASLKRDGSVDEEHLLSLVDEKTSLVSIIHVNNETGAINDVNAIAKKVKVKNPRAIVHVDGVQAFGKLPYRLSKDVDFYALSAHKIGGVKGTGALIKKKSLHLNPYLIGGGQENGLRSGTENLFGIQTLFFAAEEKYQDRERKYREMTEKKAILLSRLSDQFVPIANGSPYIASFAVKGVRGEILLHKVNDLGLIIGTGSACSSNAKKRYSRVILSCGYDEKAADGVIRLSFTDDTTAEEMEQAADILREQAEILKEELK